MKKKTLMLITDISGYTRFLTQAGHEEGLLRTQEMLQIIISTNSLGLTLCEIEGDAVFFYSVKKLPSGKQLLRQIGRTYRAFNEYLCRKGLSEQLGIKFFVHGGECEEMRIGGRTKLFGTEVIRVHRLLKSAPNKADYLLVTEIAATMLDIHDIRAARSHAEFAHIGDVEYDVYDGESILAMSKYHTRTEIVAQAVSDLWTMIAGELTALYRISMSMTSPFEHIV